jgi:hypothetical protein
MNEWSGLKVSNCALDLSSEMSFKSDTKWVKYEEETDPSSKS